MRKSRKQTGQLATIAAGMFIMYSFYSYANWLKVQHGNQGNHEVVRNLQHFQHAEGFVDQTIVEQTMSSIRCIQTNNGLNVLNYFEYHDHSGNYLNDMVILTTVSSLSIDFAENWLASIRLSGGKHPKIYIIAADQKTYDHFYTYPKRMINVTVISAPQYDTTELLKFNSKIYKNLVSKRPHYILDILKSGRDVLFSDVDMIWFGRPYRFFNGNFDLYFLQDKDAPGTVVRTNFAFYRATNATIQFVESWINEILCWKQPSLDQVILNRLVVKHIIEHITELIPDMKLKILNPGKFVSSKNYFNETLRKDPMFAKPVVLHNNWNLGHDAKVELFKDLGIWFV